MPNGRKKIVIPGLNVEEEGQKVLPEPFIPQGISLSQAVVQEGVRKAVPGRPLSIPPVTPGRISSLPPSKVNQNFDAIPWCAEMIITQMQHEGRNDRFGREKIKQAAGELKRLAYFTGEHKTINQGVVLDQNTRSILKNAKYEPVDGESWRLIYEFASNVNFADIILDTLNQTGLQGLMAVNNKNVVVLGPGMQKLIQEVCDYSLFDIGKILNEWMKKMEEYFLSKGHVLSESTRKTQFIAMVDQYLGKSQPGQLGNAAAEANTTLRNDLQQFMSMLSRKRPYSEMDKVSSVEKQAFNQIVNATRQRARQLNKIICLLGLKNAVYCAYGQSLKKEDVWIAIMAMNQILWLSYIMRYEEWLFNQVD